MLILHNAAISRSKFLIPVPKVEWREPSLYVPKDQMGNNTTQTRFRIDAKSNDGVIIWRGWFDDREDIDAFLYAIALGTLKQERALWDLPTPSWQPYLGELITYEFATVTFLTTAGSNQTYSTPSDWNNSNNSVEGIGGGASGAVNNSNFFGGGGGAGAYTKLTNLTISGNITYQVASGGTGVTSGTSVVGNAGNDTWFNDTAYPTTGSNKIGAKGGVGGGITIGSVAGGSATSGYPTSGATRYSGGNGGNVTLNTGWSGGGGAAGMNGNGGNGATPSAGSASIGGTADNGTVAAGANGTEWDSTHGSGGGSSGSTSGTTNAGGRYGGASGGSAIASGNGYQGLLVITYTPTVISKGGFNMPMLGM